VPSTESIGANYKTNGFYDEMLAGGGRPRPVYRRLYEHLNRLGPAELQRRHELAMQMFRNHGITFAVYPDAQGNEKVFPFDIIPRLISARAWKRLEAGLKQRLTALNLFLDDVYGAKLILKQQAIPPEIVLSSPQYMREVEGLPVPHGIHCQIAGIDLVRDHKGQFFVLEDNLRTPSGVSYVLANRHVMKRVLPDLFAGYPVRPVEGYVHELLRHLRWLAPPGVDDPTVVLLTPGINNAAYYETFTWPSRWASSWLKAPTWSSTRTRSSCARLAACGRSMSSTGGSTTNGSIRSSGARNRWSGWRAS